jgi:hypothetical protein
MAEVTENDPAEPVEPVEPTTEPETPEQPVEPAEPQEPPEEPAEPPEPGEPGEQPAEPQAHGATPEEIEAVYKGMESLRKTVASRVSKIMGDDATALIECPVCSEFAPGWIFHPSVQPLEDGVKAALYHLLGAHAPGDFKRHPAFTTCEACSGEGQVATGSKRPGQEVTGCPDCAELGYKQDLRSQIAPANGAEPQTVPIVTGPTQIPDAMTPEAVAAQAQGYIVFKSPSLAGA